MNGIPRVLRKPARCIFCTGAMEKGAVALDLSNGLRLHPRCLDDSKCYVGPFGEMVSDDRGWVRCHVCGFYWRFLARHAFLAHALTASEYRETYGLNHGQPLCSTGYSQFHSQIMQANVAVGGCLTGPEGTQHLLHPSSERHQG